jgi:hypothetical protein
MFLWASVMKIVQVLFVSVFLAGSVRAKDYLDWLSAK